MKNFKVQYINKNKIWSKLSKIITIWQKEKNEMDDGRGTKLFSSETVRNLLIWVYSSHFYKMS